MKRIYEKMLATFEAWRRFGFTPDEIFAGWQGRPIMILKAQGKEFVVDYGMESKGDFTPETFQAGWVAASKLWNETLSDDERSRMFRDHMSLASLTGLMSALDAKGFRQSDGRRLHENKAS